MRREPAILLAIAALAALLASAASAQSPTPPTGTTGEPTTSPGAPTPDANGTRPAPPPPEPASPPPPTPEPAASNASATPPPATENARSAPGSTTPANETSPVASTAHEPLPPAPPNATTTATASAPANALADEAGPTTLPKRVPEQAESPADEAPLETTRAPVRVAGPAPVSGERRSPREAAAAASLIAASAASVAGALALARREAWRYAILAPFVRLYSRLARGDALDHATRDRLVALVAERPGITYTGLLRATGWNRGVLLHHAHVLERHRLLQSRREGAHRRFYPAGERMPAPPDAPATSAEERLLVLLAGEPLTQREIAERLGVSQQGASYHLVRLARKGLVHERRDGRKRRWERRGGRAPD